MPETLNFPTTPPSTTTTTTTTTTRKPPTSTSFFTFSRQKSLSFPTLSSKSSSTTTTPLKPTKIPPLPSTQNHTPTLKIIPTPRNSTGWENESSDVRNLFPDNNKNPDLEFREKILYLDSLGLDPLSSLPPSAIAESISILDLKLMIEYLISLEFSLPDLRRLISMCPQVLSLNIREIAAVFTFLLREVHLPAASLRRAIRRKPRLLVSDVDSRLRPTLYFLQSIGIHEVYKHTDLLSSSVEDKYLPKIHYFEKVGFCYRDTISMFRKFPALFCYSVQENFEPKFNYFVVEMGRDLKELKEFPQYFSFSLEKRIKPRHQCCVENGVCFPLSKMLRMKEDKFRERVDDCCNSSMPRSSSPLWVSEGKFLRVRQGILKMVKEKLSEKSIKKSLQMVCKFTGLLFNIGAVTTNYWFVDDGVYVYCLIDEVIYLYALMDGVDYCKVRVYNLASIVLVTEDHIVIAFPGQRCFLDKVAL